MRLRKEKIMANNTNDVRKNINPPFGPPFSLTPGPSVPGVTNGKVREWNLLLFAKSVGSSKVQL